MKGRLRLLFVWIPGVFISIPYVAQKNVAYYPLYHDKEYLQLYEAWAACFLWPIGVPFYIFFRDGKTKRKKKD